jgi:MinD-like ATPase involved in chromosome partitioning or flagellar assembly
VNAPRLAVLVSSHRSAQSLLPGLQQSRFALTHHCLEPAQLHEAIDAGAVDVALVSTGPRGLDPAALAALARRQVPLVVLDSQPSHQCWANFAGVVLATDASVEMAVSGLEAALRGERLRQPIERAEAVTTLPEPGFVDAGQSTVDLRDANADGGGTIITVLGGRGAPGRSMLALNLATLLGRVAATVLVDGDLGAPVLAARLGANTNKNLVTVAHAAPAAAEEWTHVLSRDLQPICPDGVSQTLFLAGLPRTDSELRDGFLDGLLDALRARFDYVVCDTGVRWLDGDRIARVPVQMANTVLVATSPETAGVPRARQALDALRRYVGEVKTGIVVNQHRARKDFLRWDYEFAFGEPLSAVLPFDPEACWRAVEQRRPVVLADRRSPLTRSLVELAQRLHGGRIELPRPTSPERRSPWQWPVWFGGRAS